MSKAFGANSCAARPNVLPVDMQIRLGQRASHLPWMSFGERMGSETRKISSDLEYLALRRSGPTRIVPRTERRSLPALVPREVALTASAGRRLSKLARLESGDEYPDAVRPAWLGGQPVPRLIISAHLDEGGAFGASRLLARLDLAARRAGSLYRSLQIGHEPARWPEPQRTSRGGLELLEARVGSFDVVMTFWGDLVGIAGSAPVTVAGFIALAWDLGRGTVRLAERWQGSAGAEASTTRPTVAPLQSSVPWGIDHTKALAPVLSAAVTNNQGFEFFLDEGAQQVKLTVFPKE